MEKEMTINDVTRRDLFNLFVIRNEDYSDGAFCIEKHECLDFTDDEIVKKFARLTDAQKEEIYKMPALFAATNEDFKKPSDEQVMYLGKVNEIIEQAYCVKFRFEIFACFPQKIPNENEDLFRLMHAACVNELDEEHCAVKEGDLYKILKEAGVS